MWHPAGDHIPHRCCAHRHWYAILVRPPAPPLPSPGTLFPHLLRYNRREPPPSDLYLDILSLVYLILLCSRPLELGQCGVTILLPQVKSTQACSDVLVHPKLLLSHRWVVAQGRWGVLCREQGGSGASGAGSLCVHQRNHGPQHHLHHPHRRAGAPARPLPLSKYPLLPTASVVRWPSTPAPRPASKCMLSHCRLHLLWSHRGSYHTHFTHPHEPELHCQVYHHMQIMDGLTSSFCMDYLLSITAAALYLWLPTIPPLTFISVCTCRACVLHQRLCHCARVTAKCCCRMAQQHTWAWVPSCSVCWSLSNCSGVRPCPFGPKRALSPQRL